MPARVLTHRYAPLGAARRLFAERVPEVVMSGPAGTGKSLACLQKMHLALLATPGARGIMLRKTATSLTSSALVTFEQKVAHLGIQAGDLTWFSGSAKEPAQYRYSNGSTLTVGGMDRATRVMSTEYDLCFPASTEVFSPSPIQRGYEREYKGELVTIRTARGYELTGTPNHPVLTTRGWVGLGKLREGDYVVSRAAGKPLAAHADPHVAQQPAPIADVVRALAEASSGGARTERVETVPVDFHGDGAYGYVDVVSPFGVFEGGFASAFGDPLGELDGAGAELEELALVCGGAAIEAGGRRWPALGALAAAAEGAHAFAVGFGSAPRVGGALASGGEVGLPYGVVGDAGEAYDGGFGGGLPGDAAFGHLAFEAGDADVDGRGYLQQPPLSGEVAADRVVDVAVSDGGWCGHVYNLQTEASWYYASGIIVHNCYVMESTELTEHEWETITTRLRWNRLSYQQLMADCNPDAPTHWLKQRADRGQTVMLESRHADNPTLIDPRTGERTATGAAYLEKLERLTGVRRHRLLQGLWAAAEGVIYDGWDPSVHLISAPADWPLVPGSGRRQPPLSWQRWWSVDFGFVHPFVLQRWAEDPDGRLFLYAEHFRTRRLVEDHARDVLEAVTDERGRWLEPKPQAVLCDHDAEDRATLQKHLGLATQPAMKSVSDGLQAVASRLKVQADGRARLFVVRDAVASRDEELVDAGRPWCTEQEFPGYVWASKKADGLVKDEPLKVDDDGMDCVRYLVAQRDLVGGYRMRWL